MEEKNPIPFMVNFTDFTGDQREMSINELPFNSRVNPEVYQLLRKV